MVRCLSAYKGGKNYGKKFFRRYQIKAFGLWLK